MRSCVVRADLTDAAHGDDHLLVIHVAEIAERVDVRDFLEQFGFRVGTWPGQPGRGDLQVEMTEQMIGMIMATFDEQGRGLQFIDGGIEPGDCRPRYAHRQV